MIWQRLYLFKEFFENLLIFFYDPKIKKSKFQVLQTTFQNLHTFLEKVKCFHIKNFIWFWLFLSKMRKCLQLFHTTLTIFLHATFLKLIHTIILIDKLIYRLSLSLFFGNTLSKHCSVQINQNFYILLWLVKYKQDNNFGTKYRTLNISIC